MSLMSRTWLKENPPEKSCGVLVYRRATQEDSSRDDGEGRRRRIYVGRRSKSPAKIFASLELQKDLVEATDQVY